MQWEWGGCGFEDMAVRAGIPGRGKFKGKALEVGQLNLSCVCLLSRA